MRAQRRCARCAIGRAHAVLGSSHGYGKRGIEAIYDRYA
jgi:hypothetical protein